MIATTPAPFQIHFDTYPHVPCGLAASSASIVSSKIHAVTCRPCLQAIDAVILSKDAGSDKEMLRKLAALGK